MCVEQVGVGATQMARTWSAVIIRVCESQQIMQQLIGFLTIVQPRP